MVGVEAGWLLDRAKTPVVGVEAGWPSLEREKMPVVGAG